MDKKIKKILEYAVHAPSGDNSQPWRFVVSGNKVKIYNLPDKDNPYLNYMQSGSLIAHGALIENIKIASTAFELEYKVALLPDLSDPNLTAIIYLKDSSIKKDIHPLFGFIQKRSTNRNLYENKEFQKKDKSILEAIGEFGDIELRFITGKEEKKMVGQAGSNAEIVILENFLLHKYLFKDVMWSEKEERKEKHGLYINTMEFNPIQKLLFKMASVPSMMKIAIKLGLPQFIARQDAKLYSSGSAIGLLTTTSVSPKNFLELGMKMQEIWLRVTSLGVSFQPITAMLFLGLKLKNDKEKSILTEKHEKIVLNSYENISRIFKLKAHEVPFIMFRVGYSKEPSARSSRKVPDIKLEESII